MATKGTGKHRTYTDEFRASAVAAAIANGYPSVKGALSRTAASVGIPHQLLRNWITAEHNAPPQEILRGKKLDLRELFMNEIYDAAGEWQGKRKAASYSQLVIAVATLYDKVRLIDNLPSIILGNTEVLTELAEFLAARDQDFGEAQRQFLAMLKEQEAKAQRA